MLQYELLGVGVIKSQVLAEFEFNVILREKASTRSISRLCTTDTAMLAVFWGSIPVRAAVEYCCQDSLIFWAASTAVLQRWEHLSPRVSHDKEHPTLGTTAVSVNIGIILIFLLTLQLSLHLRTCRCTRASACCCSRVCYVGEVAVKIVVRDGRNDCGSRSVL